MPTYIVTRKLDGVEIYRYQADAPVEWVGMEFAAHDHTEYVEPSIEDAAPPAPTSVKITELAFRRRFTRGERIVLEISALDDPAAPMEQRAIAASLRADDKDVQAATYIDLMRSDTRAGVMALEQYGLIAAGRALVILDTPPTEEELFNG